MNCLLILPSAGFQFVKGAPFPAPPPDEKKAIHSAGASPAASPAPHTDEKKAPPYTVPPPPSDEKKAIHSAGAPPPSHPETKSSLTEKTIVKKN